MQSFDLSSDVARPRLEVPFHVIVRVHVREKISSLRNVELPILAEVELLGDERRISPGAGGTDYRETITVVAHHSGNITIAPVTLQAIDARDGRPKQYFSNALTLYVSGGIEPFAGAKEAGLALVWLGLRIALWIAGTACAIAIAALLLRGVPRRLPATPPPPPQTIVAAPQPPRMRTLHDQLSDALTVLRADRTRSSAVNVRRALWAMVGASEGETLADVLRRSRSDDARFRDVLAALERAAFTYDSDLEPAIANACDRIERCVGNLS